MDKKRTTITIDYQNMMLCGWDAYTDRRKSPYDAMIDPVKLSQIIVSKIDDAVLSKITICRGIPDAARTSYWYDREQARTWERRGDEIGVPTVVRTQNMTYKEDGSMQEKSVDIDCALQFVEDARNDDYDISILCTHDVDFKPALQLASKLGDGRQAVWTSGEHLTFYPIQWDTDDDIRAIPLSSDDWHACIDDTDWSYALADMPDTRTHYEKMASMLKNTKDSRMNAIRDIIGDSNENKNTAERAY